MGSTVTVSNDRGTITLDGDLTLPHTEELRGLFLKALVNADDVSLRFADVHEVDLSCLQVLCSAHRSAVRLRKQLRFDGEPPEALKSAVLAAGFSRLKGCKLDCGESCLWLAAGGANHG